jgi:hypothetical protein
MTWRSFRAPFRNHNHQPNRQSPVDTTANEYMQELPESVKRMVGEVYAMLMKGGESQESLEHLPQKGRKLIRATCCKYLKEMVGTRRLELASSLEANLHSSGSNRAEQDQPHLSRCPLDL